MKIKKNITAKKYNKNTKNWENVSFDWIEETEEIKKENKKMNKYYNEKGEEFKLYKGTISEVKDYHRRTNIYMAQDEETGKDLDEFIDLDALDLF